MKILRILLTLFFMGSSVIANAQDGIVGSICYPGYECSPYDPYQPAPVDPSPYDPDYQESRYNTVREIFLGRRASNEHLDILGLAGINGWSDRGLIIDSIEIRGRTGSVSVSLELNADGYVLARSSYPSNSTLLRPNRSLVVGQNFNQLSLGVFGTMYIDRILVHVRSGYNPPPPPPPQNTYVDGYVGQTFYSLTTLDLLRITNLQRYRGYRVVAVTVWGRNLDSRGSARIVINGQTAGRVDLQNGGERLYMPVQATVGYDLSGLNLMVAPTSRIDSVRIELAR
jgi:hypothetical protein